MHACACVCKGENMGQGGRRLMRRPSLFVLVCSLWRIPPKNKQQTHLCWASVHKKKNITWFVRIMMPQWCLFTYGAAGTARISRLWILFNWNQSPPQISRLVPVESLSGKSVLPTAHRRSLRLEKRNCRCWWVISKRAQYAPLLFIGGYNFQFLPRQAHYVILINVYRGKSKLLIDYVPDEQRKRTLKGGWI